MVSPHCSLVVPFWRMTSYSRPGSVQLAGHQMVAVRSVTALAAGCPGAGGPAAPAVCTTTVVSEYGGRTWKGRSGAAGRPIRTAARWFSS
ncbi:MAG TPA: hypothetical protein VOB72_02680 [Candidatus Dormibacteraeota bacterium]|nr:hypothetical protein [Candidatus Dormibacteraeota bacterium]